MKNDEVISLSAIRQHIQRDFNPHMKEEDDTTSILSESNTKKTKVESKVAPKYHQNNTEKKNDCICEGKSKQRHTQKPYENKRDVRNKEFAEKVISKSKKETFDKKERPKQKHVIIGRLDCGHCGQQKKIIDKNIFTYDFNNFDWSKADETRPTKKWYPIEDGIKENINQVRILQDAYNKGKISKERYLDLKEDLIKNIIHSESIRTEMFGDTLENFRFIYKNTIKDESAPQQEREEVQRYISLYKVNAYPSFIEDNCFPSKSKTCKDEGEKGATGLFKFHRRQLGESEEKISQELRNILTEVRQRYSGNDDISKEIQREIDFELKEDEIDNINAKIFRSEFVLQNYDLTDQNRKNLQGKVNKLKEKIRTESDQLEKLKNQ